MQRIIGGEEAGEDGAGAYGAEEQPHGAAAVQRGEEGKVGVRRSRPGDGARHGGDAEAEKERGEGAPRRAPACPARRARVADDRRGEKGVHAHIQADARQGGRRSRGSRLHRPQRAARVGGDEQQDERHEEGVRRVQPAHPPPGQAVQQRQREQRQEREGQADARALARERMQPREHPRAEHEGGGEQRRPQQRTRPAQPREHPRKPAARPAHAVQHPKTEEKQPRRHGRVRQDALRGEKADELRPRQKTSPDDGADQRGRQSERAARPSESAAHPSERAAHPPERAARPHSRKRAGLRPPPGTREYNDLHPLSICERPPV